MPPLKGATPRFTLYPLHQRLGGDHCNSDQHYQVQPPAVTIEEGLEMPTSALSPLLSSKLEIKNLFINEIMLDEGGTQVSHDVLQLHTHLSSNKYSCGHTGESNVISQESGKSLPLDWKM